MRGRRERSRALGPWVVLPVCASWFETCEPEGSASACPARGLCRQYFETTWIGLDGGLRL